MDIAEKAVAECRGAAEFGSPINIHPPAMDELVTRLLPHFKEALKENGEHQWRKDRPRMLAQSAAIGVLASFHAVLGGSPTCVKRDHLFKAFEFIKAGCDIYIGALEKGEDESQIKILTKYCGAQQPDATAAGYWERVLRS